MGKQRLAGLALMDIYQKDKINVEEVINRFAGLPRKWDVLLQLYCIIIYLYNFHKYYIYSCIF